MVTRLCLLLFLVIQLSYCSFAVEPDKKTNTLELIKTLTKLPLFKNPTDFANYSPSFCMPIHVYKEESDKSIVELRSTEQELLYRIEVSYVNALPDKLLIYRSQKADLNYRDEESSYTVKLYLDMQIAYKNGKVNSLTYAYDGDTEYDTLVFEYKTNGEVKRAYFETFKYGGYFEAFYSGNYPDSINIFATRGQTPFIYSTVHSTYDTKGNLTTRIYRDLDNKPYSTVHSAKYDEHGNLIELCVNINATASFNCKQYCTVYEYTSDKVSKAVEYYDIGSKDSSYIDKIEQPDYIISVYYYTFNAAGAMLTRRNFFQNYCMDTDITLVCTLDSKNMVLEKKLVHKSKSKCGGY